MRGAGVTGVSMRLLRAQVCLRDHRQEGFEAGDGEPAGGRRARKGVRQARGRDRNDPFDPWVEPDDTDAAKPWLRGDSNQREGQAIQWVCWISHLYCIGGKCGELEWGILMYSFSLSPDTESVAGQRPAPLARASLR